MYATGIRLQSIKCLHIDHDHTCMYIRFGGRRKLRPTDPGAAPSLAEEAEEESDQGWDQGWDEKLGWL